MNTLETLEKFRAVESDIAKLEKEKTRLRKKLTSARDKEIKRLKDSVIKRFHPIHEAAKKKFGKNAPRINYWGWKSFTDRFVAHWEKSDGSHYVGIVSYHLMKEYFDKEISKQKDYMRCCLVELYVLVRSRKMMLKLEADEDGD